MAWPGQSFERDADHGEADEGCDGCCIALEVACEASVSTDPRQHALDDPALGQDHETMRIGSLDDDDPPGPRGRNRLHHLWSLIAGIGEDRLDEWEAAPRLAENIARAVAILHAVGMNDDAQ